MTVRFRIRTSAGQELSFASHEMFEDFVRSGDLSPDDLVYDRESGSWAPARTHPLVLEIEYEKEEASEAEAKAEESSPENAFGLKLADPQPTAEDEAADEESPAPGAEAPTDDAGAVTAAEPSVSDDAGSGASFGLELAPAEEMMSPDEAAQAFVDKMEAERERESDFAVPDPGALQGLTMEHSGTLGGIAEPATPPPGRDPPKRKEPSRSRPDPSAPQGPEERSGRGKRIAMVVIGVAVLGAGGYFGARALQTRPDDTPADGVDTVGIVPVETPPPPPPAPEPVISSTEAAVRERAQERFLTATQNLLRELQPISDVWPEGAYLSLPSGNAEVLDAWQSYLTTIRRARAGDEERYRVAYEAALDDAAVQGDARAERLSAAMPDFAAAAALRNAHYDRVEALASAAIQSHNALLEAEGLILYDATGATGVQSGIGRGAYGLDADSQLLLDQVLDLLATRLDADGLGPKEGANVREWVWDGFLDAVAN
jgi:hypothetical protein